MTNFAVSLLMIQALLLMQICTFVTAEGMFYIYDWSPTVPVSAYPSKDATLFPNSTYTHAFGVNNGIGAPLDPDNGLFQSWQSSLFPSLFSRLLLHPKRTRDPKKATAFILPFDFGAHTVFSEVDGSPAKRCPIIANQINPIFRVASLDESNDYTPVPPQSTTLRHQQKYRPSQDKRLRLFWKNNGHDHIIILGVTIFNKFKAMFYHLVVNVCRHCVILSIETTPTQTPFHFGFSQNYIYAVPYPSSFHYHEDIRHLPWEEEPKPESKSESKSPRRDILSLFIGSSKTLSPISNKLRRALERQCKAKADQGCVWEAVAHSCTALIEKKEEKDVDGTTSTNTGAATMPKKKATTPNAISLYSRTVFCPVPAGDSYTRKAIFDSILLGCIPVLFTKGSIIQYRWFMSEEEVDEVSVYIPMFDVVTKDVDHVAVLAAIPPEVIRRKQRKIREIAPRLQYSMVPQRLLHGRDAAAASVDADDGDGIMRSVLSNGPDAVLEHTWSPPFRDAADIIVDRITDPTTLLPTQPGQMDAVTQQQIVQEAQRTGVLPDYSLFTRPDCLTIDTFNNYMRAYHPHWNGGTTSSTGELRKWRVENTTAEERLAAIIACNIEPNCNKDNDNDSKTQSKSQPQRDQFRRPHMYLNSTNMLHSKYHLDIFNLTLFLDKLRHNPNIPYIKELYEHYVV